MMKDATGCMAEVCAGSKRTAPLSNRLAQGLAKEGEAGTWAAYIIAIGCFEDLLSWDGQGVRYKIRTLEVQIRGTG